MARRSAPSTNERLAVLSEGKSRKSADVYRSHLDAWWRWCSRNGRRPWPADAEDARAYVEELSSDGLRSTTLHQRIITVLGGAHRRAGLDDPSAKKIVRDAMSRAGAAPPGRRVHRGLARHFEQVLAATPDERERALLAVLHAGRLTYDELAALTWGDVERLPDGGGLVRLRWTGETFPIEAWTLSVLDASRRGSLGRAAPLFHDGDQPLSASAISRIVVGALRAAGVYEPRRRRSRRQEWSSDWLAPQAEPRRSTDPEYLREWMIERGWTTASLSVLLGLSPARLDRWSRGIGRPPPHLRAALIMIGTAEGTGAPGPPPAPEPVAVGTWMREGGWNDSGLAAALGVSERTIAYWRAGVVSTPPYLFLAIRGAEAGTRRSLRHLPG